MSFSVSGKTLDLLITPGNNFDTRFLVIGDKNLETDLDAYKIKIIVELCLKGFCQTISEMFQKRLFSIMFHTLCMETLLQSFNEHF